MLRKLHGVDMQLQKNKIVNLQLASKKIDDIIIKLEEEFDIEIQPTQVKPDTWRSINSIIGLVKSYNE